LRRIRERSGESGARTCLPRARAARRASTHLGEARERSERGRGHKTSYSEEYTFDARSRVTTVANNLGNTRYAFVGQSSRPSVVDYANGMETQYDYFGATGDFLLKQIKNLSAGPSPSVISQFDYTYGADRSIATWKVDQGSGAKTWTFGYD